LDRRTFLSSSILALAGTAYGAQRGRNRHSGYGVGGYGDSPYDSGTVPPTYVETPDMHLLKLPHGSQGWGYALNDMADAVDNLAGRISALERA